MDNSNHIDLTESWFQNKQQFADMEHRLSYTAVWITTEIMENLQSPNGRHEHTNFEICNIIRNGLRKELLNIDPDPIPLPPTDAELAAYREGVKDATDLRKARRRWYNPTTWFIS